MRVHIGYDDDGDYDDFITSMAIVNICTNYLYMVNTDIMRITRALSSCGLAMKSQTQTKERSEKYRTVFTA